MTNFPDGSVSRIGGHRAPANQSRAPANQARQEPAEKNDLTLLGKENILEAGKENTPENMAAVGAEVKALGKEAPEKIKEFASAVLTPNQTKLTEFLHHPMKTKEEAEKFLQNQPQKTFVLIQNQDGIQMVVKLHTNIFITNKLELKDDRILITTGEGHQLSYKTWDKLAQNLDFKGYNFKESTVQSRPAPPPKAQASQPLIKTPEQVKAEFKNYMLPENMDVEEAKNLLLEKGMVFFITPPAKEGEPYKIYAGGGVLGGTFDLDIVNGTTVVGFEGWRQDPEGHMWGTLNDLLTFFKWKPLFQSDKRLLSPEDTRSVIKSCFDRGKVSPETISFLENEHIELDNFALPNCKYLEVGKDPSETLKEFFNEKSPNKHKTAIVFNKSQNRFIVAVPTFKEDPRYAITAMRFDQKGYLRDILEELKDKIIDLRRDHNEELIQQIIKSISPQKVKTEEDDTLEPGVLYVISKGNQLYVGFFDSYKLGIDHNEIDPARENPWSFINKRRKALQESDNKLKNFFDKIGINEETTFPHIINGNMKITKNLDTNDPYDLEFIDYTGQPTVIDRLEPKRLKHFIEIAQCHAVLNRLGGNPSLQFLDPKTYFPPEVIEKKFKENPQVQTLIELDEDFKKYILYQYDPVTGKVISKIIKNNDSSTLDAVLKQEINFLGEMKNQIRVFMQAHPDFDYDGNQKKHDSCDVNDPKMLSLNKNGTNAVLQLCHEDSDQVFSITLPTYNPKEPLNGRLERALGQLQNEMQQYQKNYEAFNQFKAEHRDEFNFFKEDQAVKVEDLDDRLAIKIQKDGFIVYQADPKTQDLLSIRISTLDELKEATLSLQSKILFARAFKPTDELLRKPAPSTNIEIPPIPEVDTPENDLESLLAIFDEINFTKPEGDNYFDPANLTNDGSKTTKKALREGLLTLIESVRERNNYSGVPESKVRRDIYYDKLEALLRNSAIKLNQRRAGVLKGEENITAMRNIQQQVLILAEGGCHCGGRWQSEAIQLFTTLTGQWETMLRQWGLRTQIHVMSDQYKMGQIEGIVSEIVKSGEDTAHAYLRLQRILLKDGIPTPNAEASDIADPYATLSTKEFESEDLLKMFKSRFNSGNILEFVQGKLNERLKIPSTQDRVLNELRKQILNDPETKAILSNIKLNLGTRSDVDFEKEKQRLEGLREEEKDKSLDLELLREIQTAKRTDLMIGRPLRNRFNALADAQPAHVKAYIDALPEDDKKNFMQVGLYASCISFDKRIDELTKLYEQEKADILDKQLEARGLLTITSNTATLDETKQITQKGTLTLLLAMGFFLSKASKK